MKNLMLSIRTDYERIFSNIIKCARGYIRTNPNLKSLIVGLSGGIDSALTCAIASEILKKLPDLKLVGRSIPIESNTDVEISRAKKTGDAFCDDFEQKDLTQAYRNLYQELIAGSVQEAIDSDDEKIRRGNMKARVRMIYLFNLAHFEKGMVLSTDNYTELLLGFWTLHGDVGNYGLIQYLWKTEVYGLAGYLADKYRDENEKLKSDALKLCIDAVPTDGLGITGSDFDQIGVADYEAADRILMDYLKGSVENLDHPVILRHINSEFKRKDPRNISRKMLIGDS
ncbi:MAG: NAD(+) synthase [Desulfobacterales bacterium]